MKNIILPRWIPQTPKPSSMSGFDKTWEAMSPNERRWSFLLTDLPVLVVGGALVAYGLGWIG